MEYWGSTAAFEPPAHYKELFRAWKHVLALFPFLQPKEAAALHLTGWLCEGETPMGVRLRVCALVENVSLDRLLLAGQTLNEFLMANIGMPLNVKWSAALADVILGTEEGQTCDALLEHLKKVSANFRPDKYKDADLSCSSEEGEEEDDDEMILS